jgi:hypothetical protein
MNWIVRIVKELHEGEFIVGNRRLNEEHGC